MRAAAARLSGRLGVTALFDKAPELLGLCQFLILAAKRQLGPEQKVLKRVLVKDAVDHHVVLEDLEVKAPVLGTKPVENPAITRDPAEAFVLEVREIVFGNLELIEERELLERIELGYLGCADFVEDDLKHEHMLHPPFGEETVKYRPQGRGTQLMSLEAGGKDAFDSPCKPAGGPWGLRRL